jgi:uncharacterized membrane protein
VEPILVASALFFVTHFGLSSTRLRRLLVGVLGERGFQGVYSLIAIGTLSYMIWLYAELPRFKYLWMPSPELYTAAKVLMPFSLILVLGSFMTKNPTSVGMENLLEGDLLDKDGSDLARGVTRITRHPLQWGVVLWAVAHLLANGDTISVVFFGTLGMTSGIGTVLIDLKKAARYGPVWAAYASTTSNVPFSAILGGRNRLVVSELRLPVLTGLVVYGLIFWAHEWVGGVRIL